jgi:tetratricopeptide (TPR) repeat protein
MKVADALRIVGEPGRAIPLLEPLVSRDESAIAPRVLLAWCYEDLGRASEAERALADVHELDPANPFGRPARGVPDTTEHPLEVLLERSTSLAEPSASAASVESIEDRPPERAPEPDRDERAPAPDPWIVRESEAEPERALTEEELREVPPGPLYSATLAEIFEKQGFEEKAVEIYREILKVEPSRHDLAARIRDLEARISRGAPS